MTAGPDISVVVASHRRPLRLRWLLNALQEQTLAGGWEVVVVHDYDPPTARRFIESHPLFLAGRLHHDAIAPGTGSPSRQRNVGWRQARGELVAFVDDDCRPDAAWLERLLVAARRHPGSFVQGATRPDPFESEVFAAPHVRTLRSDPPNRFAQTCNVLYPRALLERIGGLDEAIVTGEDIDLSIRARQAGARHVAEPGAVVFHAVEALTLPGAVRDGWKWRHLALVLRRHPELRRTCTLGVFWEREHLLVTLAMAGLLAARRRPLAMTLAVPWVALETGRRGARPVDHLVNTLELPGRAARELAEVLTLAAGGVRHRVVVL